MNHYAAREVSSGTNEGRWDYTCQRDGQVWPIGYCSSGCGHPTAADACAHQLEYELDHARWHSRTLEHRGRCQVADCGELGYMDAWHGPGQPSPVTLCERHADRAGLALVLVVGNVTSS